MISKKKKRSKVFEGDGIYRAKIVMGQYWGIFGEHFLVGNMTASENIALPLRAMSATCRRHEYRSACFVTVK